MATIPSQRTWTAGEIVTAAMLNSNVRDAVNFLIAPPLVQLRQAVAQGLTNNVYTSVTFDTEDRDNDGAHSTVSNTSRVTCVTPGWYPISGACSFTGNATGATRNARWAINGTAVNGSGLDQNTVAAVTLDQAARSMAVFLNAGDFLELQAFQASGGTLNTVVTGEHQPTLTAFFISQ